VSKTIINIIRSILWHKNIGLMLKDKQMKGEREACGTQSIVRTL
jgi:hypothetical protein